MKNHYSFVIGSIKRGIFVLHHLQYFVEWRCVFAHHPWKISGFKRVDYVHVDVSKNWSGPPKWMVYNGKPYFLMDDLGVPLFLETPMYTLFLTIMEVENGPQKETCATHLPGPPIPTNHPIRRDFNNGERVGLFSLAPR